MEDISDLQSGIDRQWEYGTLIMSQTAGLFGTLGAKLAVQWASTLPDDGSLTFEQALPDVLRRLGHAGWEMITAATSSNVRNGTSAEMFLMYAFKQPVARTEKEALAQLIDPVALRRRAALCLERQDYDLARAVLSRAISFGPTDLDIYYSARAHVHLCCGDEESALKDLEQAVAHNRTCGEACKELGDIWYRRGNYDKAVEQYGAALKFLPEDADHRAVLQQVRERFVESVSQKLGNPRDAAKQLRDYMARGATGCAASAALWQPGSRSLSVGNNRVKLKAIHRLRLLATIQPA